MSGTRGRGFSRGLAAGNVAVLTLPCQASASGMCAHFCGFQPSGLQCL